MLQRMTLEACLTALETILRDDPDVTVTPRGRAIRFWIGCEEHCPLTYLFYRTTSRSFHLRYAEIVGALLGLTPPDTWEMIAAADATPTQDPKAVLSPPVRRRLLRARRLVRRRQEATP